MVDLTVMEAFNLHPQIKSKWKMENTNPSVILTKLCHSSCPVETPKRADMIVYKASHYLTVIVTRSTQGSILQLLWLVVLTAALYLSVS